MPLRPRNRKKPGLRETTVAHNSVFAAHRLKCRSRKHSGPAFPFLNNADGPPCIEQRYAAPRADFADIFCSGGRPPRENHSGERTRLACWPTRLRVGELLPLAFPSTLNHMSRRSAAKADQLSTFFRGHSSVGRAPALQAGSQGFESPYLQSLQGVEATSMIGQIIGSLAGA